MLEKLRLENFQLHSGLEIEFDPQVTTIIGDTDSGKSTILRAIRFITHNQPANGIIRNGQASTVCELYADGFCVTREKGKSVNCYRLDGKTYEGLGQGGVPQDVQQLLRIGPLNFGWQHEVPFWFGLSAPEVSRQLNAIVDLTAIDESMSDAAGQVRTARAAAEACRGRLEEAREQKAELHWVLGASEQLSIIEGLSEQIAALSARETAIASLVEQAQRHSEAYQRASARAADAAAVISLGEQLQALEERLGDITALTEQASFCERRISRPTIDLSALEKIRQQHLEVSSRLEDTDILITGAQRWQQVIERYDASLEQASQELSSVKVCPLCKQPMKA